MGIESEVKATWIAETSSFVDEVLTVNDVLRENERRLTKVNKATKSFGTQQKSMAKSLDGALEKYIGVEVAMQVFNGVLDAQTQALSNAADAAERMAAATDAITGVQGGLTTAVGVAGIRGQGALASTDVALQRAAQQARLAEFDANIAGADSAIERLFLSLGKFGEGIRQAAGVGTEGEILEALRDIKRSNDMTAAEARRTNETRRVIRDTD